VHLDIYGSGTDRTRLERLAAGMPVTFHGHIAERGRLAAALASADVVLAPCGVESFGLAVLEALACGTPVVTTSGGASGEMVTDLSGYVAQPNPVAMADGVLRILKLPEVERRVAARAQAELHPWSRTVAGMLEVHHSLVGERRWERPEAA
jgi:alpha-1,6-mannosyltransferase